MCESVESPSVLFKPHHKGNTYFLNTKQKSIKFYLNKKKFGFMTRVRLDYYIKVQGGKTSLHMRSP